MQIPTPLRWLYKGWMAFSHALGRVMSTIILTVLWLVGFGVYAIILKLRRLVMHHKTQETYWVDALPERPDSMRQQF